MNRVLPYTKSDAVRLASMVDALAAVDRDGIHGDIVECGVWKGGNVILARLMSPLRTCWLYDTFDGMTEPDEALDVKRSGERAIDRYNAKQATGMKWDAVSVDEVRKNFEEVDLDPGEVNFVVGPVEDTLQQVVPDAIALLRLDVDWYAPTKVAMEVLYPKVTAGGFVIVDDYGHWMGCRKAIKDYFGKSMPMYCDVDYSCRVFRRC